MTTKIISNESISVISNFAQTHGVGDAQKVGELFKEANVALYNSKHGSNEKMEFQLTTSKGCYNTVLANLEAWHENSSPIEWVNESWASIYEIIRKLCFCEAGVIEGRSDEKWGLFTGQSVIFQTGPYSQSGYVVGFNVDIPSLELDEQVNLVELSGQMVEVILFDAQSNDIVLNSVNYEYITTDPNYTPLSVEQAAKAKALALAKINKQKMESEAIAKAIEDKNIQYRNKIRDIMPSNAKSVLVAFREVPSTAKYADSFETSKIETVILGFSTHSRQNFNEMRKFALNHPATAFLSTVSKDNQLKGHYGSNYLAEKKNVFNKGWYIEKIKFYSDCVEHNLFKVPNGDISAIAN